MIHDLINFGEWLNENNQVDFGKNVNDVDLLFTISYKNDEFKLGDISKSKDIILNYFDESCFSKDLYHTTNQNMMVPSNSNLLGFTPFFIKLDHDFLKNGKKDYSEKGKINKFKGKINRSIKSNKNHKEFVDVIDKYFNNNFKEEFLNHCLISNKEKENLECLNSSLSSEEINNLIIKYYEFIKNNSDKIIDDIISFKKSESYDKKEKGNFYLVCVFSDCKDLLNDFFFYYSKFLQKRSKSYEDYDEGICSFCGSKGITFPGLSYYGLTKSTSFNYAGNIKESKLRLCRACNSLVIYANDKLNKIINLSNIVIIPKSKSKNRDYSEFLKISNEDTGSFKKINKFLKNCDGFNFDLMIYTKDNALISIKRYVENYQAFLLQFKDLNLYNDGLYNYLFNEEISKKFLDKLNKNENTIFSINNTFSFEYIFKEFFYDLDNDGKYKFPNLNSFYQIYTKKLTDKNNGIFNNEFNPKIVSVFSRYMEDIFQFIYELNLSAINKEMFNEIVLNSVFIFQKNTFGGKEYGDHILKRLNYYYMFKKEFLEDNMLSNETVINLKKQFGKSKKEKDKMVVKFDEEEQNKVLGFVSDDPALKYYLIGQFIRYIDNFKSNYNKNRDVFSNFITNVNRNNISKLFVSEILQKNNFYINKFSKKGKFLFSILEVDITSLFNEDDFTYEDYILLLFTGYYTTNILSSKYEFKY